MAGLKDKYSSIIHNPVVYYSAPGAPDIFVAFSALQDDDVPLVLG